MSSVAVERGSRDPQRALALATRISVVVGAVALVALIAAGRPLLGLLAAAGVAIGVVNNRLADRAVGVGAPFLVTSGFRILGMTVLVIAVFVVLHSAAAIALAGGLAVAQLSLSAAALREASR